MKKICWITESWAFDTDKGIVPYLMKKNEYDIKWYILCKETDTPIKESINYTIIKIPYRYRDPRNIYYYYKIFNRIQIKKYDAIYSSALGIPYYYPVLFLQKGNRQPLIHAAHNVIPYPVWTWQMKVYIKYIFKKNKYFQLFSKFTSDYFKKKYPHKSFFYCPMTLKSYGEITTNNYKIENNKLNLLFFGNIVLNKRLDILINAIKDLPKEIKTQVHLTIAGKCNNPQPYINLIDNDNSISTYFKRIDDREIAELFSKHDFLVLPYQDVAQSGPHMIAYYYNLPVIASDIDGFKERIEDGKNGLLFKSRDVKDLKNKIVKAALMSYEDRVKMKKELKEFAINNFSVEAVSKRYIKYFKTIIK